MPVNTIAWVHNRVVMVDQTRLPLETVYIKPNSVEEIWEAIKTMKVRGAPAIGISAAFGVYLAARDSTATSVPALLDDINTAADYLASARPTAVNLFWALRRVRSVAQKIAETARASCDTDGISAVRKGLLSEAEAMIVEDNAVCLSIGYNALPLLRPEMGILTHCNAGGLGTARWGTALAPIFLAHEKGWPLRVFADETRPVLQGARLTAWELQESGVHVTLICDNMAGSVLARGWVQAVIVGTDRVAANGDVVNKIGTYSLAVLAHHHGVPSFVAAPRSSIDLQTATGAEVPIEERSPQEVTEGFGRRTAPPGVDVFNPAFDVTPAELVTAIITETGVLKAPYPEALAACLQEEFKPTAEVRKRAEL